MAGHQSLSLTSAAPYAYTFEPNRTALVIIDVQRDFVDPNGFGSIQCSDEKIFANVRDVVKPIRKVLEAARSLGLHIVHTREGHEPGLSDLSPAKRDRQMKAPSGKHAIGIGDEGPMGRLLTRGQYGHDIVDELKPRPDEVIIDKPGKGSFWNTDLHRKLMARGISHLLICGVTTECCVTTTAREASDRGFECCILTDATGGFNSDFVSCSLQMMSSFDGLWGFTSSSRELLQIASSASEMTPPGTPELWDGQSVDMSILTRLYRKRALSPSEIVEAVFTKMSKISCPNAWTVLRSKTAVLEDAKNLAARYPDAESLPPLFGIPFAIKDSFDVADMTTSAACPAYEYVAKETSPLMTALKAAGGIFIGKTNMDQLATGLSGCRSPLGNCTSVFGNGKYVSGGSSSGCGVVVASGIVTFALGTDTAGSGRVPAAYNGIVGYKPTKGTFSTRQMVPCCPSLDTGSIFATRVEDARKVWYILDQHDALDPFAKNPQSLPFTLADYRPRREAGFTFATPPQSAIDLSSAEYQAAFSMTVKHLSSIGGRHIQLTDDDWLPFKTGTDLLYTGSLVNERIASIGHDWYARNLDTFHPTIKTLFKEVLEREKKPWDVYADQLLQKKVTHAAARLFSRQHGKIDVLVSPTTTCHPTIPEMEADPVRLNLRLGQYTQYANVLDLCAMSVNAGFVQTSGGDKLPFGLMFVCASGMDGQLFDIAQEFEGSLHEA